MAKKKKIPFARKKEIPEPDEDLIKIGHETVTVHNLYRMYEDDGLLVPSKLQQYWDKGYDCNILEFNVGLRKSKAKGAKGVKEFYVEVEIEGGSKGGIHIDDIVPKTSWVDKHYSADVDVGLDLGKADLGLIPLKIPVKGGPSIRLHWQPKVGEVIADWGGRNMSWRLKKTYKRPYLDGQNGFAAIIRWKRPYEPLRLHIIKAEAIYHKYDDDPQAITCKRIPLEIIERKEKPKTGEG